MKHKGIGTFQFSFVLQCKGHVVYNGKIIRHCRVFVSLSRRGSGVVTVSHTCLNRTYLRLIACHLIQSLLRHIAFSHSVMIENVDIEELVQVFATRYRGAKLSGAEMRKEIGEMLYQSAQVTFLKNSVQSDISD